MPIGLRETASLRALESAPVLRISLRRFTTSNVVAGDKAWKSIEGVHV